MEQVKSRPLELYQRVQVYRNLHKGGYSIRDKKSGLVVAHADSVLLESCRFHVSETGRQRTIEAKQKRVHAWVEGDFVSADTVPHFEGLKLERLHYDPYKTPQFTAEDGRQITESPFVYCVDKVCYGEV